MTFELGQIQYMKSCRVQGRGMETNNTPLRNAWNGMQNAIRDWAKNQCDENLLNVYTAITSFYRQLEQIEQNDYDMLKQALWDKFKTTPLKKVERDIESIRLAASSPAEQDILLSEIKKVKDRLSAIEGAIVDNFLRFDARVCPICGLWRVVE